MTRSMSARPAWISLTACALSAETAPDRLAPMAPGSASSIASSPMKRFRQPPWVTAESAASARALPRGAAEGAGSGRGVCTSTSLNWARGAGIPSVAHASTSFAMEIAAVLAPPPADFLEAGRLASKERAVGSGEGPLCIRESRRIAAFGTSGFCRRSTPSPCGRPASSARSKASAPSSPTQFPARHSCETHPRGTRVKERATAPASEMAFPSSSSSEMPAAGRHATSACASTH